MDLDGEQIAERRAKRHESVKMLHAGRTASRRQYRLFFKELRHVEAIIVAIAVRRRHESVQRPRLHLQHDGFDQMVQILEIDIRQRVVEIPQAVWTVAVIGHVHFETEDRFAAFIRQIARQNARGAQRRLFSGRKRKVLRHKLFAAFQRDEQVVRELLQIIRHTRHPCSEILRILHRRLRQIFAGLQRVSHVIGVCSGHEQHRRPTGGTVRPAGRDRELRGNGLTCGVQQNHVVFRRQNALRERHARNDGP